MDNLAEAVIRDTLNKGKTVEIPSMKVSMKKKEVVDGANEYASEIESLISDLVYFLDKDIPYPLKDFSLTELISFAEEFNSIVVNTQLDLSQLIREMKGAQLWD